LYLTVTHVQRRAVGPVIYMVLLPSKGRNPLGELA